MIAASILQNMRKALNYPAGYVPLHEPRFLGNEQRYLQECISSTYVSSIGSYVDRFEKEVAAYTGARRAIAVVNGTAALQVSLQLAGVRANDEVIVPALTFVATANAVHYLGAVPHFADISENNISLNPLALREWLRVIAEPAADGFRNRHTGRRLSVVVPMHTFGHPCDLDGLLAVAHDYRLAVVEDAAEALGSFYNGQHAGTFGLLGTLSFNGNKIITTGGGGAILTNDDQLADHAKHLTSTAKLPHRWNYVHDEVGYNFRMPNLNAALGCAQLEQLPRFLDSKRRLFNCYEKAFSCIKEIHLMQEPKDCSSNYWLQTIILSESAAEERDKILQLTNDAGFMTRPVWQLLHNLKPYEKCPRAPLSVANSMARRVINLPSSVDLVQ